MSHQLTKGATTILCGAGVGAVLMYLLDPAKGKGRRNYIAAKTVGAASAAGEAVGHSLHSLAHQAHDLSAAVAEHARHLAEQTGSAAADAGEKAQDLAEHLGSRGTRGYHALRDYASKKAQAMRYRARSMLGVEESGFGPLGVTVAAVTALSVGAGLMYLLDPMQGGGRRRMIRRTATRAAGATRDAVGRATHYVSSYATGAAKEAHDAVASNQGH